MKDYQNIILKDVCKTFGSKTALNSFSATFKKGEFVTFLGPSGLLSITSGGIYIDDECIDDGARKIPPEKREFGMVFQNYALFPHLSVFKNIAFGLQLRKIPKQAIKDKVEAVLKLVHLEQYENKFPMQLSGGEQQRVAIARCIVLEPRLLMLDEPLSNLDAKLRIDMRYELISLHTRLQISTIYVTHDQSEALALSDRIVVMKSGCIQQIGTPEEVYSRPANLFVADFMGFKNIWAGTIEQMKEAGEALEIAMNLQGLRVLVRSRKSDLGKEKIDALRGASQRKEEVFCAVRPEDINLGAAVENKLACKVNVVEYLGQTNSTSASLANGHRIDFKAPSAFPINEAVDINIPADKMQIFVRGGV
jgi:putative spermidine/putrescine transport system ATP-binding protein